MTAKQGEDGGRQGRFAVRLDRIVTRTGDDGTTAIAGGVRLFKDAPRIEAIGALDEANAALGLLRADLAPETAESALILALQHDLFDLGAALARPKGGGPLGPAHIARLEEAIAAYRAHLAPLRSFVLPGANRAEALAHLARTQVRRAERALVALAREAAPAGDSPRNDAIPAEALPYLNRLSDLLFLLARHLAAGAEVLWRPGGGSGGEDAPAA